MAADTFTGANGTALTDHDANWLLAEGDPLTFLEIRDNCVNVTAFTAVRAYYSGSNGNCSQITWKYSGNNGANLRYVEPSVRDNDGSSGYSINLTTVVGGNFTECNLYKSGSWAAAFTGSWSASADHTLRVEATTVGGHVHISAFVDGVYVNVYRDTSSPIFSGYSGFGLIGGSTNNIGLADNWSDAAPTATEVVRVVDPDMGSGYAYDSLSDWEADLGDTTTGNLPNDGQIAVAKCRCTGGTADATLCSMMGWTTDAQHYIKVWTDPTEGYRHNGTWQTGNKYRFYADTIFIYASGDDGAHYVTIDGLQFGYPVTASNNTAVDSLNVTGWTIIRNCVFYGNSADNTNAITVWSNNQIIYNNIIIGFNGASGDRWGIFISANYPTGCAIYNNTIVDCTTGIRSGSAGDGQTYENPYLKNNILYNCTTPLQGIFAPGSGYNATEDASLGASYSVSGGATGDHVSHTFTFVGAPDYHLQSTDVGAKGLGLNLYNDAVCPFQTDIDGQDRGGAAATVWDIGADEYTAGTVTKVVDPDSGTGYDYHSLTDWEADQQKNLPNNGEIATAKCRCTGGTADTAATTVDGWTTDSTRHIKIWTDTAETYRHAGLWETGNHYRMETGAYTCIIVSEAYVKIEGLQLTCTGEDHHNINIGGAGVASFSWISFCILKGDEAYTHGIFNEYTEAGSYLYAWNNVINAHYRGINNWTNSTAYIYNCTIVNCINGGMRNLGTAYCKNVLSKNVGAAAGDFSNSGTMVCTNCAGADDTADDFGGSGNRVNQTFTFVGAADFHLQSTDAGAKGYGLNLYNDATIPFQTDIDGQDRGGALNSDSFTGENGTLLNTHDAKWDPAASTNIAEIEIQSNAAVCNVTWASVFAIYNNGQSANQSSQGVLKATAAIQMLYRSLLVRASSTTEGYRLLFDDGSGTTYTKLVIYKNGTWCYTFQDGGSWSCLSDITLRLDVVTVGSDAVLTAWLNGVQIGSAYTDSSTPITTGLPGFQIGSTETVFPALDDWCDLQPWDIGADEYVSAASTLLQEGFRFRNDDGDEDGATWYASQDANITLPASTPKRIRVLVDSTGDPAAKTFQLEYRRKPSGGAFGAWTKVTS